MKIEKNKRMSLIQNHNISPWEPAKTLNANGAFVTYPWLHNRLVFQGQVSSAAASYSVISRYRHCRNGAARGGSINSTYVVDL